MPNIHQTAPQHLFHWCVSQQCVRGEGIAGNLVYCYLYYIMEENIVSFLRREAQF